MPLLLPALLFMGLRLLTAASEPWAPPLMSLLLLGLLLPALLSLALQVLAILWLALQLPSLPLLALRLLTELGTHSVRQGRTRGPWCTRYQTQTPSCNPPVAPPQRYTTQAVPAPLRTPWVCPWYTGCSTPLATPWYTIQALPGMGGGVRCHPRGAGKESKAQLTQ